MIPCDALNRRTVDTTDLGSRLGLGEGITQPRRPPDSATSPYSCGESGTRLGSVTVTATPAASAPSYPPAAEFVAQANAGPELYRAAESDRLAFWAEQANQLSWATPFAEVLDYSDAPFARWFADGKLNVAYNCVDRHVEAATATGWRSTGRASRMATPAPSPMRTCSPKSPGRLTR